MKPRKFIKIIITILFALLFTLPYCYSFAPWVTHSSADNGWVNLYILTNIELSLLFIPYALLWFIFLMIKSTQLIKIIYMLFFGLSLLLFISSFLSFVMPLLDYSPSYGVLVCCLFFSILCMDILISYFKQKEKT